VVLGILVFGGAGHSGGGSGSGSAESVGLTIRHGYAYVDGYPIEVGVTPSLLAGTVGLTLTIAGVTPGGISGDGDAAYPTAAEPLFGPGYVNGNFASGGNENVYLSLVGSAVAEMRVSHLGTFKPVKLLGLLAGQRAIVFSRPRGAPGRVFTPGTSPQLIARYRRANQSPALIESLYNSSGKVIRIESNAVPADGISPFHDPTSTLVDRTAASSNARCAARSTLAGASTLSGEIATSIAADRQLSGPAFLSCLDNLFIWHGDSFEVAILLNAEAPGHAPAALWNAAPIPGHPGLVEVRAERYASHYQVTRAELPNNLAGLGGQALRGVEQYARRHDQDIGQQRIQEMTLTPPMVATRVGNAWLIVQPEVDAPLQSTGGSGLYEPSPSLGSRGVSNNNLAKAIQFLSGLRVTKLDLSRTD
jgi:hypothetical protein